MTTLAIDPDADLIISAFETTDDLGRVLRSHLAVEGVVDQLITQYSRAKLDGRTSFWGKVNLMRAMGVPEALCGGCEALNELRNKLAHKPKVAVDEALIEKFIRSVEIFFPKMRSSHGSFERKSKQLKLAYDYATATPGQRVVVAAGFLSGLLGAVPRICELGERRRLAVISGFVV